jgi:hypothetical protein
MTTKKRADAESGLDIEAGSAEIKYEDGVVQLKVGMRSNSVMALHEEGFYDGEEEEEEEEKGPAGMAMLKAKVKPQMTFATLCRSEHSIMYFQHTYPMPEVGEGGRMPGTESAEEKKLKKAKEKEAKEHAETEAKEEAYWADKEGKEEKEEKEAK